MPEDGATVAFNTNENPSSSLDKVIGRQHQEVDPVVASTEKTMLEQEPAKEDHLQMSTPAQLKTREAEIDLADPAEIKIRSGSSLEIGASLKCARTVDNQISSNEHGTPTVHKTNSMTLNRTSRLRVLFASSNRDESRSALQKIPQ